MAGAITYDWESEGISREKISGGLLLGGYVRVNMSRENISGRILSGGYVWGDMSGGLCPRDFVGGYIIPNHHTAIIFTLASELVGVVKAVCGTHLT